MRSLSCFDCLWCEREREKENGRSDLRNDNIERPGNGMHGMIRGNEMDAVGSRRARSLWRGEFEKELREIRPIRLILCTDESIDACLIGWMR